MYIFFDTEFTGLHKDTTLISIGLIDEDDNCFYAEFNDYDVTQIDDWINDNVISNLLINSNNFVGEYGLHYYVNKNGCFSEKLSDKFEYHYGNKEYIKNMLLKWFEKEMAEQDDYDIELISDVCHYDMTLFIDIFGGAFDLPDYICPACYDITSLLTLTENCTMQQAFDLNREDLLNEYYKDLYKITDNRTDTISFNLICNLDSVICEKHSSMWDAKIIKELYGCLFDNMMFKPYRYKFI